MNIKYEEKVDVKSLLKRLKELEKEEMETLKKLDIKEDMVTMVKFIEDPTSLSSTQQLQDSMYAILYGLAKIGRLYPVARVALIQAMQQLLREGW